MDHDRTRLEENLFPGGARSERQIGVFVIRRRIALIERAELAEEFRAQHDRRAGTVVRLASEVVARIGRIVEAAVVPSRSVAEHDAAGLLQATIRINELRADQPGLGFLPETIEQRPQPAGRDDGIVVEEHDVFALRDRGARVARSDEAEIRFVADDADAGNIVQTFRRPVGRAVVDDDGLERNVLRVFGKRAQTRGRVSELVEHGNHDRDQWRVAARNRERCEIFGRLGNARRGERQRLVAELVRRTLQCADQAAAREAAACAMNDGAHSMGVELQARLRRPPEQHGAAQRSRYAPRSAVLHRVQIGVEFERPLRSCVELDAQTLELRIQVESPFAAPHQLFLLLGNATLQHFVFARRVAEFAGACLRNETIETRRGFDVIPAAMVRRQQIAVVARHVVECAVRNFRQHIARAEQQAAVRIQSRDQCGDIRRIRRDEKTIDAVANAFGERAEPRGDDGNPEADQFGQCVAERFREVRQDERCIGRDLRKQRGQFVAAIVEQDVHIGLAEKFFAFRSGAEQEYLRVRTNLRQQFAQHRRGFAAPHASEHHQAQAFTLRRWRQRQCGVRRPARRAVRDDVPGQRADAWLQLDEESERRSARRDQRRANAQQFVGETFAQIAPVGGIALGEFESVVGGGQVGGHLPIVEGDRVVVEIPVQQRPQRIEIVHEIRRGQSGAQGIQAVADQ